MKPQQTNHNKASDYSIYHDTYSTTHKNSNKKKKHEWLLIIKLTSITDIEKRKNDAQKYNQRGSN